MNKLLFMPLAIALAAASAFPLAGSASGVGDNAALDLGRESDQALQNLYKVSPLASSLSKSAKAVLVFPRIVKAGFFFGGAFGEGELLKSSGVDSYYNSVTASWGLQAGAQSYGYAVFLMTNKADRYLGRSDGWELGVGPTIVVVDEGAAKNMSTSTMKDDAYAFIFDQQGLMAGVSIEGTKISHIKR